MGNIPSNVWQSDAWKNFQNTVQNRAFWVEEKNAKALIVERKPHFLKFWKKKFWEIPRGPIGKSDDFATVLEKIFLLAQKENVAFVRIFPPFFSENFWEETPIKNPFSPAPEIFSEHTLCINLSQTEDEILANMKQKGRYNIRLAEKKGVKIVAEKNVENFFGLVQETSKRDGFVPHRKKIYEKMLHSFAENAVLLSAFSEQNELLASAIFVQEGKNAVYYYGASTAKNRELMAPYLLQWHGILWAKNRGAQTYDFLGISPENAEDAKNHRLKTVSDFKLKFGGFRMVCAEGRDFPIG